MFGSTVLDIAIGLAFLYLLLALICTTVNELIESFIKKRATDLERGILEMLGNEKEVQEKVAGATDAAKVESEAREKGAANAAKWLKQLYEHPLIFSLFGGKYEKGCRNLPSYIPARNFAVALLDAVKPANEDPETDATRGGVEAPAEVPTTPTTIATASAVTTAAGLSGAAGCDVAPTPTEEAVSIASIAGAARRPQTSSPHCGRWSARTRTCPPT